MHIIAYQMFRYFCIRLTEINVVDVCMVTHQEVFFHRILLVTCHVFKDKNRIWARLAQYNDVVVVRELADRRK